MEKKYPQVTRYKFSSNTTKALEIFAKNMTKAITIISKLD